MRGHYAILGVGVPSLCTENFIVKRLARDARFYPTPEIANRVSTADLGKSVLPGGISIVNAEVLPKRGSTFRVLSTRLGDGAVSNFGGQSK